MTKICGKVWTFGDNIDTDRIMPACHLVLPLEEMRAYAMAPISQEFARRVTTGDLIVAGNNFGCGSSREQAPEVLKALGIKAIVAKGFARIFFRNAVNLGLPVIECDEIQAHILEGDEIEIDPAMGEIYLPKKSMRFLGSGLPDFLLEIILAGGWIPHYLSSQVAFPRNL